MTAKSKTADARLQASRPPAIRSALPGSRSAHADPRWPRIAAALAAMREQHRRAVRIVDADCACGALLIEAVRHARSLGFTAVEGRGIDGSPAMIGRARAAAARVNDPGVGLQFELADTAHALAREVETPADLVLWHGNRLGDDRPGIAAALAAGADLVIADQRSLDAGAREA